MDKTDKRVDAYINEAADFAKPILVHIRKIVHKACPGVEETIKWGFPHFDYKGMLCSMAAFKQHCAFGFWKAAFMSDATKLRANNEKAMGNMGQLKSISDLPQEKLLMSQIKEAMHLNDEGVKLPPRKKVPSNQPIEVPSYFNTQLKKHKKAQTFFDNSSSSCKREYIQWITEAKSEDTRNKRMASALEWLSEGKSRNWKYEKC